MAIIKQNNMAYQHKVGTDLSVGSGLVRIYPLPIPYPCFEIRENPNPNPNSVIKGKTRQIGFGSGE